MNDRIDAVLTTERKAILNKVYTKAIENGMSHRMAAAILEVELTTLEERIVEYWIADCMLNWELNS